MSKLKLWSEMVTNRAEGRRRRVDLTYLKPRTVAFVLDAAERRATEVQLTIESITVEAMDGFDVVELQEEYDALKEFILEVYRTFEYIGIDVEAAIAEMKEASNG